VVALIDGERRGAHPMGQRASPGPAAAWGRRRWGGGGLTAAVHGDLVGTVDSYTRRGVSGCWRWRWHPVASSYNISRGWGEVR
jgi:hypothetical protein